jgi:hypothetical protein
MERRLGRTKKQENQTSGRHIDLFGFPGIRWRIHLGIQTGTGIRNMAKGFDRKRSATVATIQNGGLVDVRRGN